MPYSLAEQIRFSQFTGKLPPEIAALDTGAAAFTPQIKLSVAPTSKTSSTTLTAAELLTGVILGTGAAAVAYTLPLATAFETALLAYYPNLPLLAAFDFAVTNLDTTAANTITVTTNTGWTLSGAMVLPGNNVASTGSGSSGNYRAVRTAANTYTLYRAG